MPPAWRNQRLPTGTDTPTFSAASAVLMPLAIRRQNCRCTAREGSGRPGERIGGRNARSARHWRRAPSGTSIVFADQYFVAILNTSTVKVLRRPVESADAARVSVMREPGEPGDALASAGPEGHVEAVEHE